VSAVGWWDSARLERYRFRRLSGRDEEPREAHAHWYQYLLERFPELGRGEKRSWLSLCCGSGQLERYFAGQNAFVACVAVDASRRAVDEARRRADEEGREGIEYRVADLNTYRLPEAAYDVVIAQGGLHHITALEALLERVAAALKPDGLFLMHEYVGASRLRFGARQREVINALMHLVPPAQRGRRSPAVVESGEGASGASRAEGDGSPRSLLTGGLDALASGDWERLRRRALVRGAGAYATARGLLADVRYGRGPYARLFRPERFLATLAVDRTESVRSADLPRVLEERLDVIEVKPLGGTALWWLQDFDWGVSPDDPDHEKLVELLIAVEDMLLEIGDLSSDVVHVAARRKGARR
jgi:SAM-dependent methyltransferase